MKMIREMGLLLEGMQGQKKRKKTVEKLLYDEIEIRRVIRMTQQTGQLTGRCPCLGENRQAPCTDGGEGLRCRLECSPNTTVGARSSGT